MQIYVFGPKYFEVVTIKFSQLQNCINTNLENRNKFGTKYMDLSYQHHRSNRELEMANWANSSST